MCKKYPGPRCSFHTKAALDEATQRAEADPSPENIQKREDAQYAFNTSPDGIKALQALGTPKGDMDAEFFQMVRQQQIDHLAAKEAKERKAMQQELAGLYSPQGIEEVRAMGDDDLADRLEERIRRASIAKSHAAGVVFKTDFTKPKAEASEAPDDSDIPSMGRIVLAGAVHGAIAGFESKNGGVMAAVKTGMRVGKGEAAKAEAQQAAQVREQAKATAAQEREEAKAQKAFEREQARLTREQERFEKADIAWHNKLEADCIRYIKAQQREAAKRTRASRPSTAPKRKKSPQPQAV